MLQHSNSPGGDGPKGKGNTGLPTPSSERRGPNRWHLSARTTSPKRTQETVLGTDRSALIRGSLRRIGAADRHRLDFHSTHLHPVAFDVDSDDVRWP